MRFLPKVTLTYSTALRAGGKFHFINRECFSGRKRDWGWREFGGTLIPFMIKAGNRYRHAA